MQQCCEGEESCNHRAHKKARREMEEALILGVMIMKEQSVYGITMKELVLKDILAPIL
jgi:hypothetical protein